MEPLNLDGPMRRIAAKHGIDVNKIDIDKVLKERSRREELEAIKFTAMNNRIKRNRLFNSSLISDVEDLHQSFDSFEINDDAQSLEFNKAKEIADRIISGETGNFTFAGRAGSGKTMLAVSILNQIMNSKTTLSCYFVSFSMLLNMTLVGIKDFSMKQKAWDVEDCIKVCDVLVLDDLGSESAMKSVTDEASNYTQSLLFRLADYRKSKVNIVTTNNSSKELQSIYNPKIYSRLIAKKASNAIRFDSEDMRNI
ncbi:ATP-binding protein [Companilactobacillus sp. FL22-1]|uniref:ATP-binding protein n=1 Tax=Companilactobacillus sp. FL22-1 TaxID=3373892 RepID=UPI0037545FB4